MSDSSSSQSFITFDGRKIASLPTLDIGDEHSDLVEVQNYLRRFGYLELDAETTEARLDPLTAEALRKFQLRFGVEPTGRFDPATRDVMQRPRCGVPDFPERFELTFSWDRVRPSRVLTYTFKNFTKDPVGARALLAVDRAFATWSRAGVGLQFRPVPPATPDVDILVEWTPPVYPDHNLTGRVLLAHADFPPNPGEDPPRLPKVLHFDEEETWIIGSGFDALDVETVALHEIGHLLGMLHEELTGAVMEPFYRGIRRELSSDDLAGIRTLYRTPQALLTIGDFVVLQCLHTDPGHNRFLVGRTSDGTVRLAPEAGSPSPSGLPEAIWKVGDGGEDAITLECQSITSGNRFLEGRTSDSTVRLAPDAGVHLPATTWRQEHKEGVVNLVCLGGTNGNRYLEGRIANSTVGLAPHGDIGGPFTGTKWWSEQRESGRDVLIRSAAFSNVYLRMDGRQVTEPNAEGSGKVNCQFGAAEWERFRLERQGDGTFAIASAAFSNVYLRMDGRQVTEFSAEGSGKVDCQFGAAEWERFIITAA